MRNKAYIILAIVIMMLTSTSITGLAGEKEVNSYVNNNKIIIPFRDTLESLGYEVLYDKKTRTAIAKDKNDSIKITINSNKAIKNGKEIMLQETIKLFNNRIMVSKNFFKDIMELEIKETQKSHSIAIHINKEIDLSNYFKGYKATFKLYNMNNGNSIVYNEEDLKRRTSPASTYKILNSLIALQTGAVGNENTIKKWDGTEYPIPEWNKDHTLSSAMKDSVVWYYQDVARDIGKERMQKYIGKVGYGNQIIGEEIDMFWLDGSLQISPQEQLDIVRKLYNEELPFDKDIMKTVKEMIINKKKDGSILAGKTGTYVHKGKPEVGWYVGYVVENDTPYVFVTRLEKPDIGESQIIAGWKAKLITIDILKELNIFHNE